MPASACVEMSPEPCTEFPPSEHGRNDDPTGMSRSFGRPLNDATDAERLPFGHRRRGWKTTNIGIIRVGYLKLGLELM